MLFTDFDKDVWQNQKKLLTFFSKKSCLGTDEVGRGCLAGPVVAASVILPSGFEVFVADSKKLSKKKREMISKTILSARPFVGIAFVHPLIVDQINILNATKLAMKISIQRCLRNAEINLSKMDILVCIDGNFVVPGLEKLNQCSIIQGDDKIASVAAASVLAKVTRDAYMKKMASSYPEYGLDRNKGYGTVEHVSMIKKIGITPFHRKSFCKGILNESH